MPKPPGFTEGNVKLFLILLFIVVLAYENATLAEKLGYALIGFLAGKGMDRRGPPSEE